ncbi:hypothetical protein ACSX1A_02470 [Pontibacter sp. MBLB2868]|uniref:hypothetical protein n=1 Tax=Pontibacter sp. MBLB2868 TaxID=3451555 RepID=UPI003F7515EE
MKSQIFPAQIISGVLGVIVLTIGVLNLLLVHPVPGIFFMLVSLLYAPQTNAWLQNRFGFTIPPAVKIMLGMIVIWFTLGVSDLGDMID